MCGLFGMASTYLSQGELALLRPMVHLSSLRGVDSVGVCHIFKEKKKTQTHILKGAVLPAKLIYSDELEEFQKKHHNNIYAVLGHTRHATVGTVKASNAHPFRVEHIVWMHNGSIPLLVPKDSSKTDSETIFEMLAEDGLTSTLERIKHGAYALVWYDQKENKVNFVRNSERPLTFIKTAGFLGWLSEKDAAVYFESKSWFHKATFMELPVNTLATFTPGSVNLELTSLAPKYISYKKPQVESTDVISSVKTHE